MGFFSSDDQNAQSYDQVQSGQNQSSWSHEIIGGAAAYEASKSYENYESENGKPESHAKAKEILAGFAGAETDRLIETKGLDWVDGEKAKYHAKQQLDSAYDNQYQ